MKIFEFDDYKALIRTYLRSLPSRGHGQIKRMAEHVGVHTTLMSQILSGDKDLSLEQAQKAAGFLGLNELETDYFLTLVQIERAGTRDLKKYFENKKADFKKESLKVSKRIHAQKSLSEQERSVFYSTWLFSAVHLFCSTMQGRSLTEIVERFQIPSKQALEILRFLTDSGLCELKDSVYRATVLSTHVEKGSPHLLKHHSNWRIKAIQRSENLADEELMFTGNISLSREDFAKVREVLVQTIKQVSELVKDSPAEDIANLNLDLFYVK
jgi:uncharacterized protein (TIGR02147 family)